MAVRRPPAATVFQLPSTQSRRASVLKLSRQGGALFVGVVCAVIAGSHSAAAQTSTLPSGWKNGDIGAPAVAGSAQGSAGTITVRGGGLGIGGTSDQFQFVYLGVTGDVDIRVRLADLDGVNPGASAGLMMREALSATSKSAYLLL